MSDQLLRMYYQEDITSRFDKTRKLETLTFEILTVADTYILMWINRKVVVWNITAHAVYQMDRDIYNRAANYMSTDFIDDSGVSQVEVLFGI
jgi:hypothetical protein